MGHNDVGKRLAEGRVVVVGQVGATARRAKQPPPRRRGGRRGRLLPGRGSYAGAVSGAYTREYEAGGGLAFTSDVLVAKSATRDFTPASIAADSPACRARRVRHLVGVAYRVDGIGGGVRLRGDRVDTDTGLRGCKDGDYTKPNRGGDPCGSGLTTAMSSR